MMNKCLTLFPLLLLLVAHGFPVSGQDEPAAKIEGEPLTVEAVANLDLETEAVPPLKFELLADSEAHSQVLFDEVKDFFDVQFKRIKMEPLVFEFSNQIVTPEVEDGKPAVEFLLMPIILPEGWTAQRFMQEFESFENAPEMEARMDEISARGDITEAGNEDAETFFGETSLETPMKRFAEEAAVTKAVAKARAEASETAKKKGMSLADGYSVGEDKKVTWEGEAVIKAEVPVTFYMISAE